MGVSIKDEGIFSGFLTLLSHFQSLNVCKSSELFPFEILVLGHFFVQKSQPQRVVLKNGFKKARKSNLMIYKLPSPLNYFAFYSYLSTLFDQFYTPPPLHCCIFFNSSFWKYCIHQSHEPTLFGQT